MNFAKRIVSIVIITAFSFACKNYSTKISLKQEPIPATFGTKSDSISSANISWRKFFTDPDLIKLIDLALTENQDLKIAIQKIEMANASVRGSRGLLFPQVNINAGAAQRKYGLYTMDGAGNISTYITPGQIVPIHLPDYVIGVQSSWEADIWGKLRNQKKSAKAMVLASVEAKKLIESNLVAGIATAYYNLCALDLEMDIINATIQKQEEALEVISLQKEAARANELAVQQFKAQLLNSKALEAELKQEIIENENLINLLIGRFPQSITRNKYILMNNVSTEISEGIPSQLLTNRPDVREAEYLLLATKCELKSAKAAFFPVLNISAGIGFQAFDPSFLFLSPQSMAYSAVGSLVAPLVNQSAIRARFKLAKASQIAAMYNYQKVILNAFAEVLNELNNLKNLQEINNLKTEQNEILTLSVQTARELYRTARASYLDLLVAQQNSLQTNLELINTHKRQKIARVNIYRALGGGWR